MVSIGLGHAKFWSGPVGPVGPAQFGEPSIIVPSNGVSIKVPADEARITVPSDEVSE